MRRLLALVLAAAVARGSQARRVQVYGFSVTRTDSWRGYDWSLLTTSAWNTDPELIATAQQHGARVEVNAGDVSGALSSAAALTKWVQRAVVEVVSAGAAGINFDMEGPAEPGSALAANYTLLVAEAAASLRAALPGATVSVDVPWLPGADGRHYDFAGLGQAADLLFVMVYDTASQILGRCLAGANSPLDAVRLAVQRYLQHGIPAAKLVLGLPWYGYDYACVGRGGSQPPAANTDACFIEPVAFRGVACSDAAGAQKCYHEIMTFLREGRNTTEVRWDGSQASPYFNYRADDGSIHQVWFDDPRSLALKAAVAAEHGLAGLGFWNLDCLDATSADPTVRAQTAAMWGAVREAVAGFKQAPGAELERVEEAEQAQQHRPAARGGREDWGAGGHAS